MQELWRIGIRVSILDYATIGLRGISRAFIRAEGDAAKFEKRLASIRKQMVTGGLMVGAGIGLAMSLKPAVDKAIELEQVMNRLKALNLGTAGTNALVSQATTLSRTTKGTSIIDALRLATETQSITANVEHTQDILPMLAKIRFGLNTYGASHGFGNDFGEKGEQQFRDIIKVMELRGLMRNFSASQAQTLGDLFTKNYVASGGQVKPSDFLQMLKTGGVAGKLVDNNFMFALGHMMQESGGLRSGTALMSGYQNLIAGRTTQQVAEQLQHFGLLKPGSIEYSTTGKIKKIKPEALIQSELLQTNPLEYMNKVLLPAMAAKGVDTNNINKVLPMLNTMMSNRTASNFFAQLYMDRAVIANYMKQSMGAAGVDQLYNQSGKSTVGNLADMQAKFNTLLATLGTTVLPVLNRVLELLIPKVQALTNFMQKHPVLFERLVNGLLGLSAVLIGFGTLNILVGSFRGLALAFSVLKLVPFLSISSGMIKLTQAMLLSQLGGPGQLVTAARNFGILTTAIGTLMQAAAVFAAAYVGWKIGQQASNALDRSAQVTTGSSSFGAYVYERYHPFNPKTGKREWSPWKGMWATPEEMQASEAAEGAYLHSTPSKSGMVQVHTDVHLDGQKIATVVSKHQAKQAASPQTGMSGWDSSMFPSPIGVNTGN